MSRRSKGTSHTLQYHGRLYSNSWPLRPHMAITCFEKKFSLINFYLVFVSRFTSQIHFLCELRIQKYNAHKILGIFLLYCTVLYLLTSSCNFWSLMSRFWNQWGWLLLQRTIDLGPEILEISTVDNYCR